MKANELMIGDWVQAIDACCGEPCILRVTYIDKWKLERPHVGVDGDISQSSLPADCLEGIPITAEILEKSGLRKVTLDNIDHGQTDFYIDPHFVGYYTMDKQARVHCSPIVYDIKQKWAFIDDEALCRIEMSCPYVHQLQHALRLCGMEKEIEL